MQEIIIRPMRATDAADINMIRRAPGVFENMLAMPSERIERSEAFCKDVNPNVHLFVAVLLDPNGSEQQVVGNIGMTVSSSPRLRHSASIGIMVHKDYQGMGVGSRLMEAVLDIADNWMLLTRLELGVYPDNTRAIHLYEKYGFEREGVKRMAVIRAGRYTDEIIMSRLRPSPQQP